MYAKHWVYYGEIVIGVSNISLHSSFHTDKDMALLLNVVKMILSGVNDYANCVYLIDIKCPLRNSLIYHIIQACSRHVAAWCFTQYRTTITCDAIMKKIVF